MRQELFPEQWILHPSLMLMINAPRRVSSLKGGGGVAGRRSDVIYMNVHDLLRLVSSEAAMKQNRARISGAEVCRSFRSFSWRRTWGKWGGGEEPVPSISIRPLFSVCLHVVVWAAVWSLRVLTMRLKSARWLFLPSTRFGGAEQLVRN